MKLLPALILIAFVCFSLRLAGQDIFPKIARFEAMSGTFVASDGGWSVFGNQAGLANIIKPELAGSFQNHFSLNEFSGRTGLFVFPVQSSVFALSIFQFGEISFRREKYSLAYARRVFPKLNVGFQFNYYRLYFPEENKSAASPGIELGIQYILNKKTVLGVHVRNPYKSGIKTSSGMYYYRSGIVFGVLYHASDSFRASSELENDFGKHLTSRTGLEYDILKNVFLRAGISGIPVNFSAGFGFKLDKFTIDLASSYHIILGNSPSVAFLYQF